MVWSFADRQRRARSRAQKTTGVVVRTINDARGIAEPLERYGELLTCQIILNSAVAVVGFREVVDPPR